METQPIYIQTANSLADFKYLANRVTNMCNAEVIVRQASTVIGDSSSEWMRNFCTENFSRFSKCNMYKILIGEMLGDKRQYHYVPNPF